MKKKSYWYKQFLGECPMCGRNRNRKERVMGKKPKDKEKIYIYLSEYDTYCGCMERGDVYS